ncbi:MAG: hypothetical protein ACT4NP_12160 [Pseudonocardiales bacterium]
MAQRLESITEPDWARIAAFTGGGVVLLAVAYFLTSYWQSVLVNGGTALLLFGLLVRYEPRLVRLVDAARRQPRNLDEALARFAALVAPAPQTAASRADITDRVLTTVCGTGLHQQAPGESSARFTDVNGSTAVDWWVEWDVSGIRHVVTVGGAEVAPDLAGSVGWDSRFAAHEKRVYAILCLLLRKLADEVSVSPDRPATAATRALRFAVTRGRRRPN